MKTNRSFILMFIALAFFTGCSSDEEGSCPLTTWYQDADNDGLGNPNVSQSACQQPSGFVSNNSDTDDSANAEITLHSAFDDFDKENFTIYLDGSDVVLETNGHPNHTSPYWSSVNGRGRATVTSNHPLFVEPTVTSYDQMAPGFIDDFDGFFTLRVSANPSKASRSSSTGLGPIGMAISGAVIYNDQEGPNVPIDNAISSLDYTGAHTGPQSYHYHIEPIAWSLNDDKLIGIIADGFFLYGRKCNSTGNYPNDLDASGGHISTTQHSNTAEYHYHIQNELYLNQYYILFPGDYQGTPNAVQ